MKRRWLLVVVIVGALTAAVLAWPGARLGVDGAGEVVDLHVHTAGIGAGGSGIFLSEQMRHGYKFNFYLRAFDVTLEELEAEGDVVVLRKLSAKVRASQRVSKAVVLALDGIYDEAGRLDRQRTQVYVPNEFLARELAAFDNLLFGASVNPKRHDALAELERVKRHGAVLIKWIPPIMDIDPSDPALTAFYDRLRELDLPLLTHAGRERSFGPSDDDLGDPKRLALPLERGVTVIAAHTGGGGSTAGERNFDRLIPMFERYENLYADISALTQVNRTGYLREIVALPGITPRLLYGSDWPLQFFPLVSPWYQLGTISVGEINAIRRIDNAWDRDVALKEAVGIAREVFERPAKLLKVPP